LENAFEEQREEIPLCSNINKNIKEECKAYILTKPQMSQHVGAKITNQSKGKIM
jgi:hypothetical protein